MANLLDEASILLTPTAYNNGSMLAVKPENGDGDFTFSRNSSATRVNAQGLVENVASNLPRIDYTDGCGSWLLEPQSTNLLTYSEQFDNASWINNGVTINANQVVSPGGSLTADLLTGVSGGFGVVRFSTWTATNKVASCFAKAGSTNLFKIANASFSNRYVIFDLNNGTVSEESTGWTGFIENYGNGWYRCIAISNNETGTFSLGVTAASESIYIWGAQLESGYKTSYIPTSGAISTRLQDIATNSGNASLINSEEGVLYAEISALADDLTNKFISISNGSKAERVEIGYSNVSNKIFAFSSVGNVNQCNISFVLSNMLDYNKIAISYAENNFALWVNGVKVGVDLNASVSAENILNELAFDEGDGTDVFYSKTKALAVYKTALTDAQLTLLTTI